jgi:hypothetical protein
MLPSWVEETGERNRAREAAMSTRADPQNLAIPYSSMLFSPVGVVDKNVVLLRFLCKVISKRCGLRHVGAKVFKGIRCAEYGTPNDIVAPKSED